jgi:hypothetical protein
MIAFLFALMLVAMLLAYAGRTGFAYLTFAAAFALSVYWFSYHATSSLNLQL